MSNYELPPEDDDVLFLMKFAKLLDKNRATVDYAVRLRQIAMRLQQLFDKPHIAVANVKKHRVSSFAPDMTNVAELIEIPPTPGVNYIGKLNELFQRLQLAPPSYHFDRYGADNRPEYRCEVIVPAPDGVGFEKCFGIASSKKDAKQKAAFSAINYLRITASVI